MTAPQRETPTEFAERLAGSWSPLLDGPVGMAECGCPNNLLGQPPALHLCRTCGFQGGPDIHGGCAGCAYLAETAVCCDLHGPACEPLSELCCEGCTETAHDTFPAQHADGTACVPGGRAVTNPDLYSDWYGEIPAPEPPARIRVVRDSSDGAVMDRLGPCEWCDGSMWRWRHNGGTGCWLDMDGVGPYDGWTMEPGP